MCSFVDYKILNYSKQTPNHDGTDASNTSPYGPASQLVSSCVWYGTSLQPFHLQF